MLEHKMGSMNMKKLILSMSVPIMISMLIQALYNIVDSMFVAKVSQDALAAVSLCFPIQTMIIAVSCGTGVGLNAVLSRRLGQKRQQEAEAVALHGIFLAACSWIVFAFFGFFCARIFLSMFTEDTSVLDMGVAYIKICTVFSFGVFIQIAYERIMQATGNPVYNMLIQGVGAIVNIVLDPIFIFGAGGIPAMGVRGAAIATVIGQITAMILGIILTRHKVKDISMNIRDFQFSAAIVKDIYKIGIPAILMQSIMSFMTVFMNLILASFSTLAVSVFGIYYKLQQFVYMAVNGMNNALIPILSYNYGAGNYQRIKEGIQFSLLLCTFLMLAGTLVFQILPVQLLYLFQADAKMLSIGIPAMRIISLSFLAGGICLVVCSICQALDRGRFSLLVTLIRQLLLLVPLCFFMAYAFGLNVCWWSFPITELLCASVSIWYISKTCHALPRGNDIPKEHNKPKGHEIPEEHNI